MSLKALYIKPFADCSKFDNIISLISHYCCFVESAGGAIYNLDIILKAIRNKCGVSIDIRQLIVSIFFMRFAG
ncbi:hypothetical protein BWP39_25410 [Paraburkholderia acidicola]|uniref:Uncharacterized protein n=1 Tax=Paraburkholderia acidicola TaxID=1912599 RepID=A0A2A4ES91_9BURK|nr:hypothetical protein BWP39_25410 [Paraburkholderia acidicola]